MTKKSTEARRVAKKKKRKKLSASRIALLVILLVGIIILGVGCTYVAGAVSSLPEWDPQKLAGSESTTIYDRDEQPASHIYAEENRTPVSVKDLPPYLPDAFIAIEDHRFDKHHGVDIESIGRAVIANIKGGVGSEGGSTITQQLVKNSFLTHDKTFKRKIQEAILSIQVERHYSKDEIIEFYLNRIFFGDGAYGIQTASQYYFDKSAEELTLAEGALLAGIVRSPNNYNPYQSQELAKSRQELVLSTMVKHGKISQQEAAQAKAEELEFIEGTTSSYAFPYFTDHVISEAEKILQEQKDMSKETSQSLLYRGGLKIYTTLNPAVQTKAEELFANNANFPGDQNEKQIQGAMVLLENSTGEIHALVGGRDHSQQRSFNRATQAIRQPGSAIKPLAVYAPALEKGYTTALSLLDEAVTVGKNTYKNYDHKYEGYITMRKAVQWSKNTYAVRLLQTMGIDYGLDFAKKLGITSFDANDQNLSLALGGITYGISPLEMAGAYGAIANQGVYIEPHSITKIIDRDGGVLYEAKPQKRVVMSEQTAYIMTDLLQTVVKSGTGTRAQMNRAVAGKTGTTDDTKDIWFMGYTPEFTGAVWMGFDQAEKIRDRAAAGGSFPALIWKATMQKATEGMASSSFKKPSQLVTASICTKSGKLANAFCPEDQLITEIFMRGTQPKETCDLHMQVEICDDSKLLANPYCPHKTKVTFVKGEKTDTPIPEETCDMHGPGAKEYVTVKVCTDPRHNGTLYLANIPNLLQKGGCSSEFIEERSFLIDEAPKSSCPLQEHQILPLFNNDDNNKEDNN